MEEVKNEDRQGGEASAPGVQKVSELDGASAAATLLRDKARGPQTGEGGPGIPAGAARNVCRRCGDGLSPGELNAAQHGGRVVSIKKMCVQGKEYSDAANGALVEELTGYMTGLLADLATRLATMPNDPLYVTAFQKLCQELGRLRKLNQSERWLRIAEERLRMEQNDSPSSSQCEIGTTPRRSEGSECAPGLQKDEAGPSSSRCEVGTATRRSFGSEDLEALRIVPDGEALRRVELHRVMAVRTHVRWNDYKEKHAGETWLAELEPDEDRAYTEDDEAFYDGKPVEESD
jgi:hypothetical protein